LVLLDLWGAATFWIPKALVSSLRFNHVPEKRRAGIKPVSKQGFERI
jgi:hypothetical protein